MSKRPRNGRAPDGFPAPTSQFQRKANKSTASANIYRSHTPSTAAQLAALKKLTQKESGYVDSSHPALAFDTTGSVVHINIIPQEETVHGRLAKKCKLKSLQIRGTVGNSSTATFNKIAILIVYDKRPAATVPAIATILKSVSSRSMNNDNNSGRFQVVRRFDHLLVGNSSALLENTYGHINEWIDLKGRMVEFNDTAKTGVMGTVTEGALYLVTVGNNAAGTTAAAGNLECRTRFVDI